VWCTRAAAARCPRSRRSGGTGTSAVTEDEEHGRAAKSCLPPRAHGGAPHRPPEANGGTEPCTCSLTRRRRARGGPAPGVPRPLVLVPVQLRSRGLPRPPVFWMEPDGNGTRWERCSSIGQQQQSAAGCFRSTNFYLNARIAPVIHRYPDL
jgi:hypothetical protein